MFLWADDRSFRDTLRTLSPTTPSAPAPPASGDGSNAGATGAARSEWNIGELLRWTQARFAERGIAEARLDAEHLLAHALGCNRMTLYTEHDRPVDDDARARFRESVRRRLAREPVAHIEGKRGFHALGLELAVDRRVLVPRPETEHLVDWLLEDLPRDVAAHVVDVGTGSGAIALAIKHARPLACVVAVDVSDDALVVARANIERLGADVELHRSDLLTQVATPEGGWTAIAANLPYIATAEIDTLDPEVRMFEPRIALDGGEDGLGPIRRLIDHVATVPGVLANGGAIYLEVGHDQATVVAALLRERGYEAAVRNDFDGIGRIVRARRPVSDSRADE
jgi:release factor glutamine methyltransferase